LAPINCLGEFPYAAITGRPGKLRRQFARGEGALGVLGVLGYQFSVAPNFCLLRTILNNYKISSYTQKQ